MRFRVAISGDFLLPDGAALFPMVDLSALERDGDIEVAVLPRTPVIEAADLAGFDALITIGSGFAPDSLPADGRLALVARFGVGYDDIAVDTLTGAAVALVNTPDAVRRPMAAAVLTFLLALAGRLTTKDRLIREGRAGWNAGAACHGRGLVGRILGLVGLGNIGAEVLRLCRPLDMVFLAHDPYASLSATADLGVELVGLDELFRRSDFISVNCPLSAQTRGLISRALIGLMKPTAFLINTARGPIVDQVALTEALCDGRIAGAGLDVFEEEPIRPDDPLLALDNVILAPHAIGLTDQCLAGLGEEDVAAVLAVKHGRVPCNVVNRAVLTDPRWQRRLKFFGNQFRGD